MAIDSSVLQEVVDALKQDPEVKNNVYQATVSKIDGEGVVWVNIAGSDKETPTAITSAEVEPGDAVTVEWRNNKLYIGGNYSNPAAGVMRVANVEQIADVAVANASRAQTAAANAESSAQNALASAATAESAASDAVTEAGNAQTAAEDAQESADNAAGSAILALNQLGIIENVVGVLNLLSKNGTYELTGDTEVQLDKWYFTQESPPPNEEYQVVSNPSGDPSAQGFYELVGIGEAVQNYVSSHLVLDNNGLWLQTDASTAKLFLSSTDGVVLYGTGGTPVAKYGADTLIGNYEDNNGFYIKLDSTNNEIGFYNGANKVAYMNGSQLYVANSLSFGNFIFYQRDNGHFTLKRVS